MSRPPNLFRIVITWQVNTSSLPFMYSTFLIFKRFRRTISEQIWSAVDRRERLSERHKESDNDFSFPTSKQGIDLFSECQLQFCCCSWTKRQTVPVASTTRTVRGHHRRTTKHFLLLVKVLFGFKSSTNIGGLFIGWNLSSRRDLNRRNFPFLIVLLTRDF